MYHIFFFPRCSKEFLAFSLRSANSINLSLGISFSIFSFSMLFQIFFFLYFSCGWFSLPNEYICLFVLFFRDHLSGELGSSLTNSDTACFSMGVQEDLQLCCRCHCALTSFFQSFFNSVNSFCLSKPCLVCLFNLTSSQCPCKV